ncbi:Major facilitator superfamily transporter [Cordyceps militaris]|uniref:Major facilitator superfamily transporter n=1 Tax=Cordyceps militaris TaxID=73501 RepID=A0A2H4SRS1_CORMI|nr:Major facilitator superfamily transporter [Cordyceps militaris]
MKTQVITRQQPVSTADSSPRDSVSAEEEAVMSDSSERTLTKPYCVYSSRKKTIIVLLATMTAFISTVSAQIYLPAMSPMARELNVTDEDITLTITTYMIFQGISPMFVTSVADTRGRRPAYAFCFVIYIAATVGLALVRDFAGAMALRSLQSIGSSSTMVLCSAVIADTITSAERGQYFAYTLIPQALGPSVGPTLGGVLTQYLGWRSIFWFLTIYAAVMAILTIGGLPETCRNMVQDGSILPPKLYQTPWQLFQLRRSKHAITYASSDEKPPRQPESKPQKTVLSNICKVITLLFKKESGILLWSNGLSYITFYCVPAAMPFLLRDSYSLSETEIGLMYLPLAGGVVLVALVSGRLFGWNYRRHCAARGLRFEHKSQVDINSFPIERTRLEIGIPMTILAGVCTMAWGWAMHTKSHIAVISVLNFFVGMGMACSNSCINLVLVDTNQGQAGTAMAASNITKCLIGAGATAAIVPLTTSIGAGPAFMVIGSAYFICCMLLVVVLMNGLKWRQQRVRDEKNDHI